MNILLFDTFNYFTWLQLPWTHHPASIKGETISGARLPRGPFVINANCTPPHPTPPGPGLLCHLKSFSLFGSHLTKWQTTLFIDIVAFERERKKKKPPPLKLKQLGIFDHSIKKFPLYLFFFLPQSKQGKKYILSGDGLIYPPYFKMSFLFLWLDLLG